jgi:DNA repair protein RAD5
MPATNAPPIFKVVRFYNPDGREVGRLPADTSKWMAVLMDRGVIEVAGTCVDCPSPRISTMDQVLLQLTVTMRLSAVAPPPSVPDEINDDDLVCRVALGQMLHALGLASDEDDIDATAGAAAGACANDVSTGDNDDGDDGDDDDGDDGAEMALVNAKITQMDSALPEAEPSGMRSALRPYQKQALYWLVEREHPVRASEIDSRTGSSNGDGDGAGGAAPAGGPAGAGGSGDGGGGTTSKLQPTLHPNWREQHFTDGTPWYWSTASGAISVDFPRAECGAKGGILADAMGLGKTVEMLALVVTELPPKGWASLAGSRSARCVHTPHRYPFLFNFIHQSCAVAIPLLSTHSLAR